MLFSEDDWIAGGRAADSKPAALVEPRSFADFLDSRNDGEAGTRTIELRMMRTPEDAVAETAAVSNILERCSREGVRLSSLARRG